VDKDEKEAVILAEAIRIVWDSLESHLDWTHGEEEAVKDFHKECVKEYVQLMQLLTNLY
jgi:heme-degrading monooxygenase HmoA